LATISTGDGAPYSVTCKGHSITSIARGGETLLGLAMNSGIPIELRMNSRIVFSFAYEGRGDGVPLLKKVIFGRKGTLADFSYDALNRLCSFTSSGGQVTFGWQPIEAASRGDSPFTKPAYIASAGE